MKLLTFSLIAIGLVAAAGCREPNPYFDPDAGTLDGNRDGPQSCASDEECTGVEAPACDTAAHTCAQCSATNVAACEIGEVCGPDHTCQHCAEDVQCASQVCLSSGLCADQSRVILAAVDGTDSNACGDAAAPCTLERAIAIAATGRDIVKLRTGDYQAKGLTGFEIAKPLTLAAHDATFVRLPSPPSQPPIFTITATGDVTMLGGHITSGPADGIYCTQAALHLWRTVIDKMRGVGVNASLCSLDLARVRIEHNDKGGILMGGGERPVTLTNSFITGNGGRQALNAGVTITASAGSVISANTIADNQSMTGHGLSCTAVAGDATVTHNLFYRNDAMGCDLVDNFTLLTDDSNTPKFLSLTGDFDYSLTAQSPPSVRDAFECSPGIDQEGQPRPYNGKCDYGADEYMP